MRIWINWHRNRSTRANPFLRWSRNLSLVVGVLLLGYCGYVLLDARLYEADQNRRFQQALEGPAPSNDDPQRIQPASLPPAEVNKSSTRREGPGIVGGGDSALGRIEISAIGLETMIMEGTDAKTLRRAVGHIPGTPLPGQRGNIVIAGHRDTFFRPLRNIHQDDEITLTTLAGSYRYRVDSIKVVEPDDTAVLDNSDAETLTLVTCYPFYFVGPAPKRFVVRAQRVSVEALESQMHAEQR